ncbi:MAG: mannose-1-phosphate guanylyltransferase [Acidobacteria bacterium]|nr:mannose-1-phosphate guanylyltransferase [Acidobacteriota bacterium]
MQAVIMAGGSGTRFWPASRETMPKQFLRITSDRTMLEETIARVTSFTEIERVSVVVGRIHEKITCDLVAGMPVRVLVEPTGRNTAACIGLAALHLSRISEDDPMVVLPADHFIADPGAFSDTIRAAAEVAKTGAIVTLGITPSRPETGYGYIQAAGEKGVSSGLKYYEVERFVEKPDYQTAVSYLTKGNYLWNSGIFLFTPRVILDELRNCVPELYDGLLKIDQSIDDGNYEKILEEVYPGLPSISIDYGVMERTKNQILVFRADFGWSDVGSWQALYELRSKEYDSRGNLVLADSMIVDSENNLVYSSTDRKIALLGVDDLVVVDTPDALMVADVTRSQDVKRFTEMLKRK